MPDTLGYADAVRLLGGKDSRAVAAIANLAGGALSGLAVPIPMVLSWFDAKAELARLGNQLVREFSERRGGLKRYDRTQRLEAAHAVIVVSAYFEALALTDLPFPLFSLELTAQEQARMVGGASAGPDDPYLVVTLFSVGRLLPGPQYPYENVGEALRDHYVEVSRALLRFVSGLSVWERLRPADRKRFESAIVDVPARAGRRYVELYRQLAVDFPEFAFWSVSREHSATRAGVRAVETALAELGTVLAEISTGSVPGERRAALARAHEAALGRPIVDSGDVAAGLQVPTLAASYLAPLFRAANVGPGARAADESWWAGRPVREDLAEFLTGYVTSPRAVRAPLMVLGQPGSGKSVLTKVLAARLPAADFLAVRVVLRDVPAEAELQDQIEYAVRSATGERLEWPALARSAGDAMPVVLLDGFDELLQATGVSQSDYLLKVAAFQRREADQGRPVAVLVTSRTGVADRVRMPELTVAVRLEPFDAGRIHDWLATWNRANAGYFGSRGLKPLPPAAVVRHGELAGQPLLLLMLALYDADGNALQGEDAELRQDELYERLLRSFARREVTKGSPGLTDRELEAAVAEELRRLSVVAFAMFNRNSQWVTEQDLDQDLQAIYGERPRPAQLRAALGQAETVLGRFFFVHRARARRDETTLQTYEFLHATFGEYLVARLTLLVLRDLQARVAASTMAFGAAPPDDDLLHALLSFAALAVRQPVIAFLSDLLSALTAAERQELTDLLTGLFRTAHRPRQPRSYSRYEPQPLPVPARHAAYSVNLLLLAVCAAGRLRGRQLYGPDVDVVPEWKRETMLWRSQLHGEATFGSVVGAFTMDRVFDGSTRDIVLTLGAGEPHPVDLYWTYGVPPGDARLAQSVVSAADVEETTFWGRRTHLQCRISDDVLHHALEPLSTWRRSLVTTYLRDGAGAIESAAHLLLDTLTLAARGEPVERRVEAYLRTAHLIMTYFLAWGGEESARNATLLLQAMAADTAVPPAQVCSVLTVLADSADVDYLAAVRAPSVRCGLRVIGRDDAVDLRLSRLLATLMGRAETVGTDDELVAEMWIRFREADLDPHLPIGRTGLQGLRSRLAAHRPDLVGRIEDLTGDSVLRRAFRAANPGAAPR